MTKKREYQIATLARYMMVLMIIILAARQLWLVAVGVMILLVATHITNDKLAVQTGRGVHPGTYAPGIAVLLGGLMIPNSSNPMLSLLAVFAGCAASILGLVVTTKHYDARRSS